MITPLTKPHKPLVVPGEMPVLSRPASLRVRSKSALGVGRWALGVGRWALGEIVDSIWSQMSNVDAEFDGDRVNSDANGGVSRRRSPMRPGRPNLGDDAIEFDVVDIGGHDVHDLWFESDPDGECILSPTLQKAVVPTAALPQPLTLQSESCARHNDCVGPIRRDVVLRHAHVDTACPKPADDRYRVHLTKDRLVGHHPRCCRQRRQSDEMFGDDGRATFTIRKLTAHPSHRITKDSFGIDLALTTVRIAVHHNAGAYSSTHDCSAG